MADLHAGVIDDHQTYSHTTLAKILGQDADWVRKLLENKRIPHKKVGNLRIVSGLAFRLWVERVEAIGGDKETIGQQHGEPSDP